MKRNSLAYAAAALILLAAIALPVPAQAPTAFEGDWEGVIAGQLHVRVHLSRSADGLYLGKFDSIDQGSSFALDHIQVNGDSLRFAIQEVSGTYQGTLNAEGTLIKGTWAQGTALALDLTRKANTAEATKPAEPPKASTVLPFGLPLDLAVPVAPMPVPGGGKTHLAYELHITNLGPWEMLLKRVEVFDGAALDGAKPLGTFEGELNGLL